MDLTEQDVINLTVKRKAAGYIETCYGDFGWVKTGEGKCWRRDKLKMSFARPHFIAFKDELQLLQVRLEIAFNDTAKIRSATYSRAASIGIGFGLLALVLAVEGIMLLLMFSGLAAVMFGALCWVAAAGCIIGGIFLCRTVIKIDRADGEKLNLQELKEIAELRRRAAELRGTEDEKVV